MNIIGRGDVSLRKIDVVEGTRNALSVGYKKIVFAHQANLDDTQIDLASLNFPSSLANTLVANPSFRTLTECNLRFFYKNLLLFSTSRGVLIPDISFTATNNSILLNGIQAYQNEIFYGVIDYVSSPNTLFVDARPINISRAMGTVLTTFNVGESYQVNAFPNESSGAIKVFVNGVLKYRNTNNSSTVLDRDYYEIPATDGYGTTIGFSVAPGPSAQITVISNYAYVDRPDHHIMQKLDVLATQLQSIATQGSFTLDVSQFPNVMDLKAFGDNVLAYDSLLASADTRLTSAESRLTIEETKSTTAESRLTSAEARLTTEETKSTNVETRLTSVEVKNRITKRQLAASITNIASSLDVASLRLSNLVVGKNYRLVINMSAQATINTTVSITATNNAVTVGMVSITNNASSTNIYRLSNTNVFTAAATTVLFNIAATGASTSVIGGVNASDTWVMLEELNDATIGTSFV
jgi:hypothetical protein